MKKICPIIVWPFVKPATAEHCEALIEFFVKIKDDWVSSPLVVINQRSKVWLKSKHLQNIEHIDSQNWRLHWVWSVDTCQTWIDALATSHLSWHSKLKPSVELKRKSYPNYSDCIHLLIPADFRYASKSGATALSRMVKKFSQMKDLQYNLSLGQIRTAKSDFKEIVDFYGTWKLLELWFPKEKAILIQKSITKPRSEFIAISDELLASQLKMRWLPYTQTLIFLLRLIHSKKTNSIDLYDLGRLKEDEPSDSLMEAITQVERIERAIKIYWRDTQDSSTKWHENYTKLVRKSHLLMEDITISLRKLFK